MSGSNNNNNHFTRLPTEDPEQGHVQGQQQPGGGHHHDDDDESLQADGAPPHKPPPLALLGFGFALDAYDLFIINAVLLLFNDINKPTDFEKAFVSTMALAGSMVGQIVFGTLGDAISHRSMFIVSASLMLLGSLASGFLQFSPSFFINLGLVRFLLGFGIGGEYPLSATLGAQTVVEPTTDAEGNIVDAGKTKSEQLARIFAFQGAGTFAAVGTGLILFYATSEDVAWRWCFWIGAFPCLFLALLRYYYLFYRNKAVDSARRQVQVTFAKAWARSKAQLTVAMSAAAPGTANYRCRLLCGALNWFLLDVVFYANGLFSGTILNEFTHKVTSNSLKYNAVLGAVAVIGYFAAIVLIERVGRKTLQWTGFVMMAIMYLVAAVAIDQLRARFEWFLVVYGLTFFFCNGGPNTTTYIMAAESFPTGIRATCSGWSAAAGKSGAAIGALCMAPLASQSLPAVFYICAGICIVGAVVTLKWSEDMRGVDVQTEPGAAECRARLAASDALMAKG